jgi:gliding motility-associated-like protein
MFAEGSQSGVLYNNSSGIMQNSDSLYVDQHLMAEWPGHPGKYFVIGGREGLQTAPGYTQSLGHYVIVDQSLDSGRGRVIVPAVPVHGPNHVPPPVTAVGVVFDTAFRGRGMVMAHANGRDSWVLVPGNDFRDSTVQQWRSYLLDSSGLHPTPVVSYAGVSTQAGARTRSAPNSRLFAYNPGKPGNIIFPNSSPHQVIHFDNATGMAGPVLANLGVRVKDTAQAGVAISPVDVFANFGFCFSPSSRFLYMCTLDEELYQFDLSLPPAQIRSSILPVTQGYRGQRDVQIGMDGKVYIMDERFTNRVSYELYDVGFVNPNYRYYLSALACPEERGLAANAQDSIVYLYNNSPLTSFPIVNTSLFRNTLRLQADAVRDTVCTGDSATLTAYGAGAVGFAWSSLPSGATSGLATAAGSPVRAAPPATTLYRVIGFKTCGSPDTTFVQLTVVPPPVARAGADTALCAGDTLRLGVQSPILTNRYRWTPLPSAAGYLSPIGALSSPTVQQPLFRFADTLSAPNVLRYALEVFNGGCTAYDTVRITVYPLPLAAGLAGPDTTLCPHQSVLLGTASQALPLLYAWTAPGGAGIAFLDSIAIPTPSFAQGNAWTPDSSFRFVLRITDTLCCSSYDTVQLSLLPVPALPALPDSIFCSGDTLALPVDTAQFRLAFRWALLAGQGLLLDTAGPLVRLTGINTTYTDRVLQLQLEGSDSICLRRDTLQVRIAALPDTLLNGPLTLCPNAANVPYHPTGTAVAASFWAVGGGVVLPGTTPDTLRVQWGPADSTAFIRWQPLHRLGCIGDTVRTPILLRKELATATPSGDTVLCAAPPGTGPVVRTYSVPPNPNSSFQWQVSGASLLAGQGTASIQLAIPDTFSQPARLQILVLEQSITPTDTCLGSSDTLFVQVFPAPSSRPLQFLGTFCANDTLQAVLLPPAFAPGSSYLWSLGAGTPAIFTTPNLLNDTVALRLLPGTAAAMLRLSVQERNLFGCAGPLLDTLLPIAPQPPVEAGPQRTLCSGDTVLLGTPPVAGVAYNWSPAALLQSPTTAQSTFSATNTSNQPASFTFTLSALSPAGCRNRDSVQVTLLPAPDTALRIVGDTLLCAAGSALYSLQPTPAAASWQVHPPGQGLVLLPGGGTSRVGVASAAAANTSVQLRAVAFTPQGCRSDTLRRNVQLFATPIPQLSPDSITCESVAQMQVSVTNPEPGASYFWAVQQAQVVAGQGTANASIVFDRPFGNEQTRTLRLLQTSAQGCKSDTLRKNIFLDGSSAEIVRATTLPADEQSVEVTYRILQPGMATSVRRNYALERSVQQGPFQVVFNNAAASNTFTEPVPSSYPNEAVQYRVSYADACLVARSSAVHSLLQLQGSVAEIPLDQTANGYTPARTSLDWNSYGGWETENVLLYRTLSQALPQPPLSPLRSQVTPPWEAENGSDAFTQTYRLKAVTDNLQDSIRYSWSNSLTLRYQNPLKFFNLVTPNDDGLNETFVIANVHLYAHRLTILDRWGRTVLQTDRYQNNWSTKVGGTYFYRLENRTTGEQYTGWVQVVE